LAKRGCATSVANSFGSIPIPLGALACASDAAQLIASPSFFPVGSDFGFFIAYYDFWLDVIGMIFSALAGITRNHFSASPLVASPL